jgi:hypothetical protein
MAGFGKRLSYAFRCFFGVLGNGHVPGDIAAEVVDAPAPEPAPPVPLPPPVDPGDRAVQILALLQRDGRLVDFLTEEISSYSDAQVGAAVRSVHESCRKVFDRYLKIEPILAAEEGQSVTVDRNFDPAAVKVIGSVRGGEPIRGVLQHRGWCVASVDLPPLPDGAGRRVIAQAEVEIS